MCISCPVSTVGRNHSRAKTHSILHNIPREVQATIGCSSHPRTPKSHPRHPQVLPGELHRCSLCGRWELRAAAAAVVPAVVAAESANVKPRRRMSSCSLPTRRCSGPTQQNGLCSASWKCMWPTQHPSWNPPHVYCCAARLRDELCRHRQTSAKRGSVRCNYSCAYA